MKKCISVPGFVQPAEDEELPWPLQEIVDDLKEGLQAKAREILIKHIGVGGVGTSVSCNVDLLINAIVEALQTNNEK